MDRIEFVVAHQELGLGVGPNYVIRALTTPLRGVGPTAHRGAMIALEAANAAAALLDAEHRTLWNRLAGTRVVRLYRE